MTLTQQLNNQVIKFATLGLIGIGALVVPQAAKAEECAYGEGYKICFEQTQRLGNMNRWNVVVENNQTSEYMDVTCNGKSVYDWSSRGGFSQAEAQYLAEEFCAL